MKYDLNSAAFIPLCLLISVPIIPCLIGAVIVLLLDFRIEVFIATSAVLVCYVLFILIAHKCTNNHRDYLILENDYLILKHKSINNGCETKVLFNSIKRFEYCKMSSFQGWLNTFAGIAPHSVFIVYFNNDAVFMGYLLPDNIKQISKSSGINVKYI